MEEVLIQMFKNGERIAKKTICQRGNAQYDRVSSVQAFVREKKFKGNCLVQVSEFYDADASDKMFLYKVSVAEGTVVNEYRVNTLGGRETVTIENLELHDLWLVFYDSNGDVKMMNGFFERDALIPFLDLMNDTKKIKVSYRGGVIADHVFAIEKVPRRVDGVIDIIEVKE